MLKSVIFLILTVALYALIPASFLTIIGAGCIAYLLIASCTHLRISVRWEK